MRISGGKARGITLKTPKGLHTRPATDSLRQAVFSSLGESIQDAIVLDLFAGTGAYGLEALSRGAKQVTFIEFHPAVIQILKTNIQAVSKSLNINPDNHTKIIKADVLKYPFANNHEFTFIFADPPYEMSEKIFPGLSAIITNNLNLHGKAVLELPAYLNPNSPNLIPIKKLGKTSGNNPSIHIFELTS